VAVGVGSPLLGGTDTLDLTHYWNHLPYYLAGKAIENKIVKAVS